MTTLDNEHEVLPVSPDFESVRQSILARCSTDATDRSWSACKPESGEILKAASMNDTQAVVVFERKYGESRGIRTVVLSRPCNLSKFTLVCNAWASKPADETTPPEKAKSTWSSVLNYRPESKPIPMTPADATSTVMSYNFHVRSLGDKHVICSTTSLHDAKRIVAALGNCAVYQFRDSRSYDDTTIWMDK